MRIVHIATEYKTPEKREPKPKKPSPAQLAKSSASRWAHQARQKDYQKALIEHADVIALIRKRDPTYKPRMMSIKKASSS